MHLKILSFSVAVVVAFGCTDQAPTSTADSASGPQLNTVPGGGPVVQQVSGGWNDRFPTFPRTFAFTAQRFADGTVAGKWERFGVCQGDVVCFSVDGNKAWIGTIAKDTNGPCNVFNGTEGGFRVEDNGEGANAPPDKMSLQFVDLGTGGAADYCATQPDAPDFLEGVGNIQIR
jgi:hypothetical protein